MVGAVRQDMLLWVLFVLALLVSVGWLAEWRRSEEKLEALLDGKSETLTAVLNNADSILANSKRIDTILAEHSRLISEQNKGPRNTACDARDLYDELRKLGVEVPHMPVEDRCAR